MLNITNWIYTINFAVTYMKFLNCEPHFITNLPRFLYKKVIANY